MNDSVNIQIFEIMKKRTSYLMISGISHYNVNSCAGDELGAVADDHIREPKSHS